MSNFRRSARSIAGMLACVAAGVGISTAYSGSKSALAASQEVQRASFTTRQAERGGVLTYSIIASGNTGTSNSFMIPEGISIDVETVTIENGAYASGNFDRIGVDLQRNSPAGTDYQFFISTAFETKSINFSPPMRVQSGDILNVYDVDNGVIGGFFQISFHGRVVPQVTGFQAH